MRLALDGSGGGWRCGVSQPAPVQTTNLTDRNKPMSHESDYQPGDSVFGIEYPSALAALEDRQIFAVAAIEGGFELREKGRDQYFVRLLPEQLRELGEEIVALATAALDATASHALDVQPGGANGSQVPAPPGAEGHTIPIPAGIWNARVTEEFQARIAALERAESPSNATPPKQIKPWIKP
jgi:hypothetical protein